MIYRFSVALISLFFLNFLAGCSSTAPVLGTVGPEPITLREFEEMYAKNNGGWEKGAESSFQDRERFLDLLVKLKLKLQDAKSKGLLRDTAIQAELASYRTSIASSYILEKELIEPNLKQMYERRKEMLRASHILIRVGPDAPPAETLAAFNKVLRVLDRLARSEFGTLARGHSEDPGVTYNNGDLGWFTEGKMMREFEDAAYGLSVGQITKTPARTQFGYHLIKLTARIPNRGSVQVRHILKRFAPSLEDTAVVRDSIYLVYNLLRQKGMDFATAASKFSDDPQSNTRGGDIGSYDPSALPQELASLFLTTPLDSVTVPYRAPYGYHLFKITGFTQIPPYEEMDRDLRQRYQQTRYASDYTDFLHTLKKRFNLTFDVNLLHQLTHAFDSTKTATIKGWSDTIAADWRSKVLFTHAAGRCTIQELLDKIESSQEFQNYPLRADFIEKIVERVSEAKILEEQGRRIEERHPAFSHLMQEYENGVLIYRLEQDEVWRKIHVSDSLLRAYHEINKRKYRWPPRVNIAEIHVKTDSAAQWIYKKVLKGADFGELAAQYTIRPGHKEKKGMWGLQPVTTNELTGMTVPLPLDTVVAPVPFEGGWSIIKVLAKDRLKVKTFEEALPELTSNYQEYASKQREEQWIASLKEQYKVVLNSELLREAFKKRQ